jgi:hypothetical protein
MVQLTQLESKLADALDGRHFDQTCAAALTVAAHEDATEPE